MALPWRHEYVCIQLGVGCQPRWSVVVVRIVECLLQRIENFDEMLTWCMSQKRTRRTAEVLCKSGSLSGKTTYWSSLPQLHPLDVGVGVKGVRPCVTPPRRPTRFVAFRLHHTSVLTC